MWRGRVERHEHFDADGTLTGVTVVRCDPDFTREDVALLLADQALEADMGPHGIPMSEATDPANQFAFEGFAAPQTDWAEKARQDAKDRFYEKWKDANRNGHMWGVRRR